MPILGVLSFRPKKSELHDLKFFGLHNKLERFQRVKNFEGFRLIEPFCMMLNLESFST